MVLAARDGLLAFPNEQWPFEFLARAAKKMNNDNLAAYFNGQISARQVCPEKKL